MTAPKRRDRRSLLRQGGLAVSAALLGGCASQAQRATATSARANTLIMIIRHAEKPAGSGASQGIDIDGNPDAHSLTVRGWTRAGALVPLFAGAGAGRGLVTPTSIYASGGDGGTGQRPRETVTPLAARLGLRLQTGYAKGAESQLMAAVAVRPGPTLISWQHEEIPALVAALAGVDPAPPAGWPDDRFDLVWMLTPAGQGWSFRQLPQLLLDGDSDSPA